LNLQKLSNSTGELCLIETDNNVIVETTNIQQQDVVLFLEENSFDYSIEDGIISVTDPLEELIEELLDYDFPSVIHGVVDLTEGVAKRKVVVRKGKRKVIFKCAPGQKKIGKRRCVKRPSRELFKMKRRAKRSARKAKKKRLQANRKRKISLRRRPNSGKPSKSKK